MFNIASTSQKLPKVSFFQCHKGVKGTLLLLILLRIFAAAQTVLAVDLESYISGQSQTGAFTLSAGGKAAPLYISSRDWPGVIRALGDLQSDIKKVTDTEPALSKDAVPNAKEVVLVGTLGRSPVIDRLASENKINVSDVKGQWETFIVQVIEKPLPGVERALVIAGSDKRGTIYGIYDLSEDIGISPLHFWADSPPKKKDALYVLPGRNKQGPPSVKYRGIFINDEAPDLSNWVRMKYGTVPQSTNPPIPGGVSNYNSEFYKTVFEMILRMKGNYLWPAMWNNAFNEDDPLNPKLADEYGIVMGTSHQEPMLRAQKEWDRQYQRQYGNWNWNNVQQRPVLQEFWRDGIVRNKDYESIITMGLRAENDSGQAIGKEMTEEIIGVQRKILAEEVNPDLTQIPQMWCLYKEVQDYYAQGLQVPDDVTLLWAEDNWGNVRRLPTEAERKRSGGAGIYYHFDYHGGPRDYMWINTISFPQVWEQMTLAKEYGADRIWIVNVGHLKHVVFPMEYFLNLGWNTKQWTNDNIRDYIELWAKREFGSEFAKEIADIYVQYSRFNSRRKPEILDASVYSQTNYMEAFRVVFEFNLLAAKAQNIYDKLPEQTKDAFYDLILFPVKISANYTELYITAGKNALYAQQGRTSTNDLAEKVSELFQKDADLTKFYNTQFADGKWNHFMDQIHVGYTSWQAPRQNTMPRVSRLTLPAEAALGVAVEGSEQAWPAAAELSLPQFEVFNEQMQYIDVFNRGQNIFNYTITSNQPWILVSTTEGKCDKEIRIWITVDWKKAPKELSSGVVTIKQEGGESVNVNIKAFNPTEVTPDNLDGFVEGQGVVSIEAEHFTKNVSAGDVRWEKIEDYGRTLSGLSIMPVTAKSVTPPQNSPCLEYKMYIFNPGEVKFYAVVGPSLNFDPSRGTHIAVSIDDQEPQVIEILPKNFNAGNGNRTWENSVKNNCYVPQATVNIEGSGYHTLKVWMVDPGIVVQKFVLDCGGWKPSYLGPPESYHN